MRDIIYPETYYKYPTQYFFNKDLYGSYSIDPNMCEYSYPAKNPFVQDPNINGDLHLCRDEKIYKSPQKPYYGGDSTPSFPNGLKYQDLPYFNPKVNSTGMLTLKRPKNHHNDYTMYNGF